MALHHLQVGPSAAPLQFRPKNTKSGIFAKAYHRLVKFWLRGQIGHRSEYSVERLLAFRDYYERASLSRVIAVCVLTPVPAIVVAVLIDCIPLRSPADGWRANSAFWVRMLLDVFVIALGVTAQVQAVLVEDAISNIGAIAIALGASVTYVSMSIGIAVVWHFPIPFGFILLVGPFITLFWVFTISVIGPRVLMRSEVLRGQIKSHMVVVATQGCVAMAFPLFTAVFVHLSGPQQIAFVFVLPIIKFVTKQMIAGAAEGLHEYVGSIVVFSVDVFNVFYVAICMQMAKSTVTTILMVALDSFHIIAALRAIFHQVNVAATRQTGEVSSESVVNPSINYFEDLPVVLHSLFPALSTRIRVFAPFPLPLSDKSIAFVNDIAGSRRQTHIYSSSKVHTSGRSRIESIQIPEKCEASEERQLFVGNATCMSTGGEAKRTQVAPACMTGSFNAEDRPVHVILSRKGSAARRLITFMHPDTRVSLSSLRTVVSRAAAEEAVWDALQALFHSEYLLLAEYIECALPMLYAAYLTIVFHLPVAPYYPQAASLTTQKLTGTVLNTLIFTTVEFVGFVALLTLLRSKFGFQPLYQLAFVLETQAHTLQGHLFVWTIFILRLPLKHYGKEGKHYIYCTYGARSRIKLLTLALARTQV